MTARLGRGERAKIVSTSTLDGHLLRRGFENSDRQISGFSCFFTCQGPSLKMQKDAHIIFNALDYSLGVLSGKKEGPEIAFTFLNIYLLFENIYNFCFKLKIFKLICFIYFAIQ